MFKWSGCQIYLKINHKAFVTVYGGSWRKLEENQNSFKVEYQKVRGGKAVLRLICFAASVVVF